MVDFFEKRFVNFTVESDENFDDFLDDYKIHQSFQAFVCLSK